MKLDFSPKNFISNEEKEVVKTFIGALSDACCQQKDCRSCLFSEWCNTHPESPGDTILDILSILGVE